MLLLSQDYGKHLLGVEDLLQKHALVEADIAIQANRVKAVNNNAQKFAIDAEGESRAGISQFCVVGDLFLLSLWVISVGYIWMECKSRRDYG